MTELLRRFLPRYRIASIVGIAFKAVEVIFELVTPLVVAQMIDVGVAYHDMTTVIELGFVLVVLAVVGYTSTVVCQRIAATVSQGMGTDIRSALFHQIIGLAASDVDAYGTPSLVTRVTSDVNQVQVAVAMGIRMLIRWPFLALGSIICALYVDLRLGLVFAVCAPAIGLVFWFVMSRSIPLYRSVQTRLDAVTRVTRETLEGMRVVRAFRREGYEEKRLSEAASDHAETATRVGKLASALNPATFLIMNFGIVAILWAGAVRVDAGAMSQGEVIAFVNYMTQTLVSIGYVANLVIIFMRGSASATRIMEVLDTPEQDQGELMLGSAQDGYAALTFDHVSFAYGDAAAAGHDRGEDATRRFALHDVSFVLPRGATLGVIGGTGSGKSTLASLAVRLYDPTEGSINILGLPARSLSLESLRTHAALVPQRASLLSGTIRSNLVWRDPQADDEALWQALAIAQADDFVRSEEGQLDAPVEAGGTNYSGGQRQRLTIARALVGSPQLLVLDDSASALDYATDARLRKALHSLPGRPATIIVSQRVAAVRGADQILVLDHGRMAGYGTHDKLLRTCQIYREICQSQMDSGEVAA